MRPGLLCPGKLENTLRSAAELGASMRPGLLCPGKTELGEGGASRTLCFNEAGAVMPRKGTRARDRRRRWPALQ